GGRCCNHSKQCDQPDVQTSASEPSPLCSLNCDLTCVKSHQRNRRQQDGDQQKCNDGRPERGAELGAPAKSPSTERQHAEKHQPEQRHQPVVEPTARALALEPVVPFECHRRVGCTRIH